MLAHDIDKLGPDCVVQNTSFPRSWSEPACLMSFWSAFSLTQKKNLSNKIEKKIRKKREKTLKKKYKKNEKGIHRNTG
jgi:hypothetical protein